MPQKYIYKKKKDRNVPIIPDIPNKQIKKCYHKSKLLVSGPALPLYERNYSL